MGAGLACVVDGDGIGDLYKNLVTELAAGDVEACNEFECCLVGGGGGIEEGKKKVSGNRV